MWFRSLSLAAVLSTLVGTANAQDIEFAWQGRILDAGGGAINSEIEVVASLYDGQLETTPVWTDTFTVTPTDGYLTLELGSVATLTPDVMARDRLWMGLQLGADGPLLGARQRMRSVPYATVAGGVRVIDVSPDETDCAGKTGQLFYDTQAAGLFICDGLDWVLAGNAAPDQGLSIHNTVVFSATDTAGGCSYLSSHATPYVNLGNMPWKQCMAEASRRGAMVNSNAYTSSNGGTNGWAPHRNGANAMWAQWAAYAQAGIGTSRACVVARDARAGSQNNATPNNSTIYDGDTWIYQDHGAKYFDECQLLASQAGASIITPGTLGTGTGDGYWVPSVHTCNTYEWITGGGTSYAYANLGGSQRSPQQQCMIGYMETAPE
ncbi:MAG: hypothetical protein ACJAZO_002179 [Myxococcota bacterium]|jgi:hypothetical protein